LVVVYTGGVVYTRSESMTEKKCSKCGEIKPLEEYHKNGKKGDGRKPTCALCTNAALRDWHNRNPEKSVSYGKKYYGENKERMKERARKYYSENKESCKKRIHEWREKNIDVVREKCADRRNTPEAKEKKSIYDREYNSRNRERIAAARKEYRERNKDKIRSSKKVHKHRRRALEKGAVGSFTAEQWRSRLAYYGGRCIYCGCSENIHADHRIPLSRGGTNWPANLVPACKSCNCKKGTKTETEYKQLLASKEQN
jgi:5-methylcytosine-specific restriction endonuclease McrA